jgi:hypothetical protein
MTLFTINHPDGTKSVRESNKDLLWAVVVYTPKETRRKILDMQVMYWEALLDNTHRALSDGTITFREYATHIGGLKASSPEVLLQAWTRALFMRDYFASQELPDLYQATHWFDQYMPAVDAWERLQQEYDATPWERDVIMTTDITRQPDVPF